MDNKKHICADCVWVDKFDPRQDEIERGLSLGCTYPNWEGYTKDDEPICGGAFFCGKENNNE